MGKLKDTTIPDFDQYSHDPLCEILYGNRLPMGDCVACHIIDVVRKDEREKCPGADYWFKQGLVVAMLRVQQCLSWDDEQVDDDGFARQVIWQEHAVAAIRDAFNQSAPDACADCAD
jgi:hypothetical protein